MKKKILIIAGDNLGLSNEQINYPHYHCPRYPVTIEGKEYREGGDTNALWLVKEFREKKVVAKSASLVKGDLIEIIEKNKKDCDLIVHLVMSSVLSAATYAIARELESLFADEVPILTIDSRQASSGVGVVLLRLIDVLAETEDPEKIRQRMAEIVRHTYTLLILPDLGYMYRGGRIGRAKALMGSVLKIIPVLGILGDSTDGQIEPIGKGRTAEQVNTVVLDFIAAKMQETASERIECIDVVDLDADPAALQNLMPRLSALPCDRTIRGTARLVEAVHMGPSSYAVAFALR